MCLLSVCFCVMHTSTSVRTFVRQVAHSTNFVKNDRFSTITLQKWTAGRLRQMRYLWCRCSFWGEYCDI